MEAVFERNQKLIETTASALRRRHFEVYTCAAAEEAREIALELIDPSEVVSWGGSATVQACGLIDALYARGQQMIDRSTARSKEEAQAIMRSALFADSYLMSANAISVDGQLINIDGNGNRLAALLFGPRQVIVIAGANKIAGDFKSALNRARLIAAPTNAQRFDIDTPCRKLGTCGDCISLDGICAQIVTTRICRPAGRIKLILTAESLGF